MLKPFQPRLSEAKTLLPLLRAQLAAAAPRHSLPADLSFDLLPIVKDGLFGYEIVPDRSTHTFLTIGCSEAGDAVLRQTLYDSSAPGALRLAAVAGRAVSRSDCNARHVVQQRDSRFADWPSAADAAWAQLVALFPGKPRRSITLPLTRHGSLDEALAIAYSHLSRWDPFILFFGLPDEAQRGLELKGADGAHGELVSRRPDMWVLRWKSVDAVICEEWAVALPGQDTASALAQA